MTDGLFSTVDTYHIAPGVKQQKTALHQEKAAHGHYSQKKDDPAMRSHLQTLEPIT